MRTSPQLLFWRGARKAGLLARLNLETSTRWEGMRIRVPLLHGLGLANLAGSEPHFVALIETLLRDKAGTFVDVGANLGQTLLKWHVVRTRLGLRSDYIGFDVDPVVVSYVHRLIAANKIADANIVAAGLSDQTRLGRLTFNADGDGTASVIQGFRKRQHAFAKTITLARGDDLLESHASRITLIKIDVEGGELEVLRGLRRTLEQHRPAVICEVLPVYDEATENGAFRRQRTDATEALMRDAGFDLHQIHADGVIARLERITTHGDLALTNFLWLPREAASR